jgi:hypothetical protein
LAAVLAAVAVTVVVAAVLAVIELLLLNLLKSRYQLLTLLQSEAVVMELQKIPRLQMVQEKILFFQL